MWLHPVDTGFVVLDLTVWFFDLALAAGFLCALVLGWKRVGWRVSIVLSLTLIGAIYAARVFGAVFEPETGSEVWKQAFSLRFSGSASILGGVLGGLLVAAVAAFVLNLPVMATCSCFVPGLALGQGIGRMSCFAGGCCFGKPTSLPWGVRFPAESWAGFSIGPLPLHPVQLYEMAANIALAVALFWLWRRVNAHAVFGMYLVGYGAIRFVCEFCRADWRPRFGVLSIPQWVAIGFLCLGIAIWYVTPRLLQRTEAAS